MQITGFRFFAAALSVTSREWRRPMHDMLNLAREASDQTRAFDALDAAARCLLRSIFDRAASSDAIMVAAHSGFSAQRFFACALFMAIVSGERFLPRFEDRPRAFSDKCETVIGSKNALTF